MKVRITPFNVEGVINAPPSKSYAHRLLIAAFLSGKRCVIENVGFSDDVSATVKALKSLGAVIERSGGNVVISGAKSIGKTVIDCGESGSTMRFLLPVAAALGVDIGYL